MTANNKVFLFRQNSVSNGAKLLSRALGIRMIKPEGSNFKGNDTKIVINWGSGREFPFFLGGASVVNHPNKVRDVTNKKFFFDLCHAAGGAIVIPDFTVRKMEAADWLRNGHTLFARTVLQGSGGEGIVDVQTQEQLDQIQEGTLLVKYIKKKKEFRVHIGDGEVLDFQQKKKKEGQPLEEVNWRIRNHTNGFVFCREGVDIPNKVTTQAKLALEISGLDFGAVDVLWNSKHQKAVVLEINTAPGLEGRTVLSYQKYFIKKLGLKDVAKDIYDIQELAEEHGIRIDPNE